MKRMKIVQVNKLYAPVVGGIEKVVQEIAEGLSVKDDVDMQVLVCQGKGKTVKERYNGIKLIRSGSFGTYLSMPVSFSFFKYFKKLSKSADVIHLHMPFPLGDLACVLSGFDGKVCLWWHADIVRQKLFMPFYAPIMKKLLKRADCIIVATKGHIESSKYLKPFEDKCVIIPFGIDEKDFKRSEVSEKILDKYKTSEGKKILFVGRLVYYKGIEVLLDAFSKVSGAELFIVGEGPLEEGLNKKVEEYKIKDKVHFLGRIDDDRLKACLRDCDMLAFPSVANSEAFGLVQLEAMIYGKPVINSNLPTGVPYVSIHNETGFTVEPYDVCGLAEAMQKLINDDELCKKFGENAYLKVTTEFTMENMLEKVYEKYKELVSEC